MQTSPWNLTNGSTLQGECQPFAFPISEAVHVRVQVKQTCKLLLTFSTVNTHFCAIHGDYSSVPWHPVPRLALPVFNHLLAM